MFRSMDDVWQRGFWQRVVSHRPLHFVIGFCLLFLSGTVYSQQTPLTFSGATAVGVAAHSVGVTLTLRAAGQAASPVALTGGVANLDFAVVDPGTCAGNLPFVAGQTCTLQVAFSPRYPGVRQGAVELLSLDGRTVLADAPLSGIGQGGLPVLVPGEIDTVAGDEQWIYHGDGVLATTAPVFLPNGLAVDAAGNLFLSDSNNNRIRRVDASTGLISTVAGDGTAGFSGDNGPATQAELSGPTGLVLDGAGNLYISDSGNNLIRRIDAVTGLISTVAGVPGSSGYTNGSGPATGVTLTGPQGLALTPAGDLLIADSGNAVVRLLSFASNTIRTIAGTGTQGYNGEGILATVAQLNEPWGVASRSDGAVAVADLNNHRIRLIDASGNISTVAGTGTRGFSGDSSPAIQAQLNSPADVAFDPAGDLLIADAGNNRVRGVYGSPGVITTLTGTASEEFAGDAGPANQASLYGPYALLFDPMGNIWISDMFHNRVRKISGSVLNISYRAMRVGKTSTPVLEMLYNAGDGNLTLGAPVLHEGALDPATTTCNQTAMAPTVFCNMGVQFAPTEVGQTITGSIGWPSDAPNVTPVDNLNGQVLSVEPTSVSLVSAANPGLLGQPLTLTASVTSADPGRSGTVTFTEGSNTWCNAVPLASNGTATCTVPGLSLGAHSFTAAYSGDDNNAASSSPSFAETIKQQPALALAVSSAQAVVTSTVTLNLTATDSSGTPTGAVVFYDGPTALGSVTLDAAGTATFRTSGLPIGTHMLSAQYAGDTANVSGTSNTITAQVVQATTAVMLAVSNASPTVGSTVSFSATVSSSNGPSPTGSVQFLDGSGPSAIVLGSVSLTSTGTASFSTATLTPGSHSVIAVYSGDTDNATSTSAPLTETVQQIATVTTATTDTNPLNAKGTLHLTGSVVLAPGYTADGPLTGQVSFLDGATPLGTAAINAAGQATLAVSSLNVGLHPITATYNGGTNYAASTSPAVNETVQQTPTRITLNSSATPSLAGKAITLQAAVTSTTAVPSGTVSFRDGSTSLGTATLDANGNASLTTASLSPGAHNLTAVYAGDVDFVSSTSAGLLQTVQLAQPVLTLGAPANLNSPVDAGTSVQLTANLTGPGTTPTGTLRLLDGSTVLATLTVSSSSVYTLPTGNLTLGTHTLTASYSGDADNAAAVSSTVTIVVQQAPTLTTLTSSANPLTQGVTLFLQATVTSDSANAGGQVSFYDGSTRLGVSVLDATGTASLGVSSSLTLGRHTLTASYSGDTIHAASISSPVAEQVVQTASATVTTSKNPSASGQNITFTGVFTGNGVSPSGTATFRDNGALLATVPLNAAGMATYSTASLSVGAHNIALTYGGDSNYAAAAAQLSQTVVSADTQTTLQTSANPSIYGQPLTLSASVTSNGGGATGTVAFLEAGKTVGTASLNGSEVATFTTSTLAPGNHVLLAQYLGDGAAGASASTPMTLAIKQTTALALTSSGNPSLTLNTITFTAILTNAGAASATGIITFTDGEMTLGTATLDATGHAALTVPQLSAGNHAIAAVYAGDVADLSSATAPLAEIIQLRPTATTVTGSSTDTANPQQITLIAVIKGNGTVPPSGAVTFTAGPLTLGVASVDGTGVATLTVIFETATQQIQASYVGDAAYAASQSPNTPIAAGQAPQFTLAVSPQNLTLVTKQHTSVAVTLASIKGFSDTIALGCEGLPYAATCTFTNPQLALAANGSASTTLVIDTGDPLGAGSSTTASLAKRGNGLFLCWMPAGLLLLVFGRKTRTAGQRKLIGLCTLLFTLTLALGATGCSGLSVNGTPPGTYTVKVVATGQGSGTTQAQTVTLVVTQ